MEPPNLIRRIMCGVAVLLNIEGEQEPYPFLRASGSKRRQTVSVSSQTLPLALPAATPSTPLLYPSLLLLCSLPRPLLCLH
eukprot:751570-Hanusia_phi.AAC.1